MNFLRKFIALPPSDDVASIPSGRLFLSRSLLSPKGALECLYNDSVLTIKQTSAPFCYQLCVTRAYQEGELSANYSDGDDDDEGDDVLDEEQHNTDERLFFLTPELNVRLYCKNDGTQVIRWDDISGDLGDCYEFVVDEEIKKNEVDNFTVCIYRCLYELVNEKSAADVPEKELRLQFCQPLSPVLNSQQASFELLRSYTVKRPSVPELLSPDTRLESSCDSELKTLTTGDFATAMPLSGKVLCRYTVELRSFDAKSEAFALLKPDASIAITEDTEGFFHLTSTTPNYGFSIVLLKQQKLAFYLEYLGLSFMYLPTNTNSGKELNLFLKFAESNDFEAFKHEYLISMYQNVAQNKDTDEVRKVSEGLSSVKLSGSDSRLAKNITADSRKGSIPNFASTPLQGHKAASLNEFHSPEKQKSAKSNSLDIFLGAFRKTENGIEFVSEITAIEDTHGVKHKSSLNLEDLKSTTLILQDDLS